MPMKKAHNSAATIMSEQGPDKFVENYYKKGLDEWVNDKRGVFLKERMDGRQEPLLFSEAAALVTAKLTEELPKYRREMLKEKARRKAAIFLMPLWFIIPTIREEKTQEEAKQYMEMYDEDGALLKMCEEKGLFAYFSLLHTDNPNQPTLMSVLLLENNASE